MIEFRENEFRVDGCYENLRRVRDLFQEDCLCANDDQKFQKMREQLYENLKRVVAVMEQ